MNKAQEFVAWFDANGDEETDIWDLENDQLHETKSVIDREITDQGRWETFRRSVYKFDDESYVEVTWAEGSTEYQDTYPNITVEEVEPFEETVISYRAVKS